MEDIKKNDAAATSPKSEKEALKAKYGKVYRVSCSVREDEDSEALEFGYYFKRPSVPSYDRYLKGVQQSGMTRASKTFLLDCVVDEDRDRLTSELEEYPGVALTIAGKLTEILGLTNAVNLKKHLRERAEEVRSSLVEAGLWRSTTSCLLLS